MTGPSKSFGIRLLKTQIEGRVQASRTHTPVLEAMEVRGNIKRIPKEFQPIFEPQYIDKLTGRKRKGIMLQLDPAKQIRYVIISEGYGTTECVFYPNSEKARCDWVAIDDSHRRYQELDKAILEKLNAIAFELLKEFNQLRLKTLFLVQRAQRYYSKKKKTRKLAMLNRRNPILDYVYDQDPVLYIIQRPTKLLALEIRFHFKEVRVDDNTIILEPDVIDIVDDHIRAAVAIPGFYNTRTGLIKRSGKHARKVRVRVKDALRAVRAMHSSLTHTPSGYFRETIGKNSWDAATAFLLKARNRLNTIAGDIRALTVQLLKRLDRRIK